MPILGIVNSAIHAPISVDYLVVAGGGGGYISGGDMAGGGAGGFRCTVTASGGTPGTVETALSLFTSISYTITVGGGGTGANPPADGNPSVFDSITSTGGGRGNISIAGANGGSGGGAGGNFAPHTTAGLGTANQGFDGGTSISDGATYTSTGGGGGAGGVGGNGTFASGAGNGGNGVATNISGSSVTYGGGGGGASNVRPDGTGGSGGGGTQSVGDGTANTGGGCGAKGSQNFSGSVNGGSGIVILRYDQSKTITIGAGLTGSESAPSGGYKRATFTDGTGTVSFA